jgi:L-serine dehydratase
LQGDADRPLPEGAGERCRHLDGVVEARAVNPVMLVQPGDPLFTSAAGMLEVADEHGLTLGQVAVRYEAALLGTTEREATAELRRCYEIMRTSVREGEDDARSNMLFIKPSAARILEADRQGALPLGGMLTRCAARAMAVMHVCNSKGVVCAAPTGGSAGIVPAVLFTLQEEQGLPEEAVLRALWAAGAVGLIVAVRATFAAESAGCQVEIGVAGAMGAAAVVEAAGGSALQACNAAAISMHNTMGTVCDPVGGACEIPCHTRNAVAAANAFICADLVVGGYHNPISLDETVDTAYEVGRALPCELRCTARGGIAVTPSALQLVEEAKRLGKV